MPALEITERPNWGNRPLSQRSETVIIDYIKGLARDGAVLPTQVEAASACGLSMDVWQRAIRKLKDDGRLREEVRGHSRRYVVDGAAATGWSLFGRPPGHAASGAKLRPCLCCGVSFVSEHRFNRLCEVCRKGTARG